MSTENKPPNSDPSIPPERELEYLERFHNTTDAIVTKLGKDAVRGAEEYLREGNIVEQVDELLSPDGTNGVAQGAEDYLKSRDAQALSDRFTAHPTVQAAGAKYEATKGGPAEADPFAHAEPAGRDADEYRDGMLADDDTIRRWLTPPPKPLQ